VGRLIFLKEIGKGRLKAKICNQKEDSKIKNLYRTLKIRKIAEFENDSIIKSKV
jgi:hypothetical protein